MKNIFFILLFLSIPLTTFAQNDLPNVVSGKIERIENFNSKYVTPRNIDIWLPEGYSKDKKYAVLYMHDGQMLFDSEKTWNKQAWDVDDVASKLFKENKVKEFIVVGMWNGGETRHSDYFPQKPYQALSQIEKDTINGQLIRSGRAPKGTLFKPVSDHYLKFIVEEVKPYIDRNYSVYSNKENTFIMGSSMGGLISMYAICEYPEVFGGAACLSSHWIGTFTDVNNPIPNAFIKFLENNLPNPSTHTIYFDTGDQTLDQFYPTIQKKVDQVMLSKGFTPQNWITKYYPGENHSENAWKKRLNIPIEFMLLKK